MEETERQSDFMIERIKERPLNKKRLVRRTLLTVSMALIFGAVACVTFLVLEPVISNKLYPEEEPAPVVFPEDQEEMAPEEMLSDNLEEEESVQPEPASLEEEQIQEILSEVTLDKENYKQLYTALADYTAELNHAVVTVTGVTSGVDWFNNVETSQNQASGVIIANNGVELLILADYGPLEGAESLEISFAYLASTDAADYTVAGEVKAVDSTTELAVLAVALDNVPATLLEEGGIQIATLGSSNVKNLVGTPVVALGSPMGTSGSVGYGMITAVTSLYQQSDTNYKFMQTDIYGSSSAGGVLFNLQGQVIGIITNQKTSSDLKNIITAYGITELKSRIEKMSNDEALPYLGITAMDVTDEANENSGVPYGAFVRDVDMSSPSMLAGVQQGDVIVGMGEQTITSYREYISALMTSEVGTTVELTLMRAVQDEYREMKISVEIGER